MRIVNDVEPLTAAIADSRGTGRGPAFVPTMGALHEGHLALIRHARRLDGPLVVSIFVNPTQFDEPADLQRYPRTLDRDAAACEAAGVDVVFAPAAETVYPPDTHVPVPPLPAVATRPGLEDACRPGHFEGVCQVVARLFDLVRPAVAVFGEKDYQQLQTIRALVAMTSERWPGLEIAAHPTVREPDGLALSSRNVHIPPDRRDDARGLTRALQAAAAASSVATAQRIMCETLDGHGLRVDYAVVRDADALMPVRSFARPTRGLVAAHLGPVRLIDNRALPVWD